MLKTPVTIFLPNVSAQAVLEMDVMASVKNKKVEKISQDWQFYFLQAFNFTIQELPWNYLIASDLKVDKKYQTIASCDLVAMQMTHRGAYLWGQNPLTFSMQENQQIVENINRRLMAADEQVIYYRNNQWLYLSDKDLALDQKGVGSYIGKDMFDFSYQGVNAKHWQLLATEIQMLIKQMIDYQGVSVMPPEWMAQVHFSGLTPKTSAKMASDLETKSYHSSMIKVITDMKLLSIFCHQNRLNVDLLSIGKGQSECSQQATPAEQQLLVLQQDNILEYQGLITSYCQYSQRTKSNLDIVCGDQKIEVINQQSWFKGFKFWNKGD